MTECEKTPNNRGRTLATGLITGARASHAGGSKAEVWESASSRRDLAVCGVTARQWCPVYVPLVVLRDAYSDERGDGYYLIPN